MSLALPSQRTWSVGDIVTAAELNSDVRDAVNYLVNPPLFIGVQNNPQSIATSTVNNINFDSSTVDTYSGHSNVTNPSRYVAQVAGWYLVSGQVSWSGSTAGTRKAQIEVNGSPVAGGSSELDPPTSGAWVPPATTIAVQLSVGDYVTLAAYQSTGASFSTYVSGTYQSSLTVLWIHS